MMTYEGYTALLEVDTLSGMIVGHVIGIRDEIVFQGKTVEEAKASFRETVDFYLERRAAAGQEPDKPFSGKFNVRIDPEIHRGLVLDAEARKVSLNEVVKRAFTVYLEGFAVRVDTPEELPARPEQPNVGAKTAEIPMGFEVKQSKRNDKARRVASKQALTKSGD